MWLLAIGVSVISTEIVHGLASSTMVLTTTKDTNLWQKSGTYDRSPAAPGRRELVMGYALAFSSIG